MGAEPIEAGCGVAQFNFLDQATGDPIDGTFAAGNFTTEEIEVTHGGTFQVQIGASNGASGTVTLQQSADNVFWDDLADSTDVVVPLNDSHTFERHYFSGRYIRAVYTETTAGNISLILTNKN